MILYDESYNFLGMSNKTLNRLGYEDLDEFCTYHRDFADLFEKENGLIYNFENFSWIDFVLYGGANKDDAIVKTKNGEKYSVKVKIDEIKVKDDLHGISKIYSVKLIEKELIESTNDSITDSKINLSSILNENKNIEIKKDEPKKEITDITNENLTKKSDDSLDINLSFIKNEDIKEDTKTTTPSFSLDFLKKDTKTQKEEDKIELNTPKESKIERKQHEQKRDPDVVLNFFNSTIKDDTKEDITEIKEEKKEFKLQNSLEEEKEKKDIEEPKIELNFLKKDDDKEKKEESTTKEPTQKEQPVINLNFLRDEDKQKAQESIKEPTKEEKKEEVKTESKPTINLNFLKIDDENSENKVEIEKVEVEEKKINSELKIDLTSQKELKSDDSLNFLKIDENKKTNSTPQADLNFLKIDDKKKDETPKNELKINLLDKRKEEDSEPNLTVEKKSEIIEKIKEDIDEIDKPQLKKEDDSSDIVINDALKSILNITPQPQETKEDKKEDKKEEIKEEIKINIEPQVKETDSSNHDSFNFLPNINLSIDEKKAILKEFIDDTTQNISLIEKYLEKNDLNSIKFLAIKINSSAEILGLDEITQTISKLINKNSISQSIEQIKETLNNLKKYL